MTVHLCFHGIGTCATEREPGEARYWMASDVFLDLLDHLAGLPNIELSFDDGNRSDVELALPALRERGLRATFFVLAGRLYDSASLGGNDLGALLAGGMSIGTHGWQHVPWRALTDAEARREFVDARSVLEKASGSPIMAAALPLGRYDRASLRQLRRAGYSAVYTSDRFPARVTSWLQPRYSLTADDTVESVLSMVRGRPGARELGNALTSAAKRLR